MKLYLIHKKEKCMTNLDQMDLKDLVEQVGPFGGQNGYYSYTSSGFDGFSDFGDLGDIFSSFFGGGFGGKTSKRQNGPRKGSDLNVHMDITFEQAFLGVEKEIVITRDEECSTCHGTGAKAGTSPIKCTICNGTGQVKQVQNTILRTNADNKNMFSLSWNRRSNKRTM